MQNIFIALIAKKFLKKNLKANQKKIFYLIVQQNCWQWIFSEWEENRNQLEHQIHGNFCNMAITLTIEKKNVRSNQKKWPIINLINMIIDKLKRVTKLYENYQAVL